MKFSIAFFSLLMSTALWAQPGYMGKKLSIGYSFEATPVFTFLTDVYEGSKPGQEESNIEPGIKLLTGHHLQCSYVLTRKAEILANLGYRKLSYYSAINQYSDLAYVYDAMELSADVGIRHYFKHFIAPIGTYHQLTAGAVQANLLDTEQNADPMLIYRLTYGIGMKKIVAGKVFFQMEFDYNLKLGSSSEYTTGPFNTALDTDYTPSDDFYEIVTAQNLSDNKRYNLKFGFGIIL